MFKLCGIMSQILHEGGSERLAEDGESGGGQASLARDGGGAPGRQRDHSGLDAMPPREMLQETSLRCWGGGFPSGGEPPS